MGLFQKLFGKKPKNERYQLGLHKTKENLGNLKAILAKSEKIDEIESLEKSWRTSQTKNRIA